MAGTMTAHLFRCTRPVERDLEELRTACPGEACQEAYIAVVAVDQGNPGLTSGIDLRVQNLHGLAERHFGDVVQEFAKTRQDIHLAVRTVGVCNRVQAMVHKRTGAADTRRERIGGQELNVVRMARPPDVGASFRRPCMGSSEQGSSRRHMDFE